MIIYKIYEIYENLWRTYENLLKPMKIYMIIYEIYESYEIYENLWRIYENQFKTMRIYEHL